MSLTAETLRKASKREEPASSRSTRSSSTGSHKESNYNQSSHTTGFTIQSSAAPFVTSQQSSPWMSQFPEVPQQQPPPPPTLPPSSAVSVSPITPTASMTLSPITKSSSISSLLPSNPPVPPVPSPSGYHMRFSPAQLEHEESNRSGIREPAFQNTTFKNSVWNRAHYGNPDFHPEEYIPDEDY
ncbi:hypothetical protein TrVGV298_011486 [Trichoderma virens]|nr:hypothetical protein TrVGV298_011486 [Trichoderma virens]